VKSVLLVSARERPRRLAPAFLAEDEAHLLRRPQAVGMVRPEGGAGFVEIQRAQQVLVKEAVIAADLS
jgi:hypothetical protein